MVSVQELRQLTPSQLARAIDRLRNPTPGGKIEAAKAFGIDLSLLIEQIKLSPAERTRRMHELARSVESIRLADSQSKA